MSTKNIIKYILPFVLTISCTAYGQTWSSPVQTINPAIGTGGYLGISNSLGVINGNPAMVYYDLLRKNLLYVRATDSLGTALGIPVTLDSIGDVGLYAQLQTVDGKPAVAYIDLANGDLKYIRALDAFGTTWSRPVIVDSAGFVGTLPSLQVVNGNPAISYYGNGEIKYVRSTDAAGNVWGAPVVIDSSSGDQYSSLLIAAGNPAIAYHDDIDFALKYIRATDGNGTAWGTSLTLDVSGEYVSSKLINGHPAIAYHDYLSFGLKYIRATDVAGIIWDAPVIVDTGKRGQSTGVNISLEEVNGRPAISYNSVNDTFGYTTHMKYVRAADSLGITWAAPVLSYAGQPPISSSDSHLLVVNGKPAISYFSGENINYIRSADSSGSGWSSPISLGAKADVGYEPSLQIVNGNPAISYYNVSNEDLEFVRATNSSGTVWGVPVSIDVAGVVGENPSLQIVNGNPAIAYYDATDSTLKYVRASDASGTAWGVPVTLDLVGNERMYYYTGFGISLLIVNGNPAISYYSAVDGHLKFVRAKDATGAVWNTAVTPDASANLGQFSCLHVVNGAPAISYYDATSSDLKYIRAADASGNTWGTPIILDAAGNTGEFTSLQIVNGNPAVAYYNGTNRNLNYIRAVDASGLTWGAPAIIDSAGDVGWYPSLQVVNGSPAVSYISYPNGFLKYVHATDAEGVAWATPSTLDSNVTQFTSMISNANGVAISYYSFSQKVPYFIYTPSGTLPITLTNVNAQMKNSGVQVEWTVREENNVERYEVERSRNGQLFSKIGAVQPNGNSTTIKYELFDPNPISGVNFYRIKIVDKSAGVTYSEIVKLNVINVPMNTINIYPNPIIGSTVTLQLNLRKGRYLIFLTNKQGQQLFTEVMDHPGGSAIEIMRPSKVLSAGVYQIRLTGNGINIVRQVIKD